MNKHPLSVVPSTIWLLCEFCNTAFALREKLLDHKEKEHIQELQHKHKLQPKKREKVHLIRNSGVRGMSTHEVDKQGESQQNSSSCQGLGSSKADEYSYTLNEAQSLNINGAQSIRLNGVVAIKPEGADDIEQEQSQSFNIFEPEARVISSSASSSSDGCRSLQANDLTFKSCNESNKDEALADKNEENNTNPCVLVTRLTSNQVKAALTNGSPEKESQKMLTPEVKLTDSDGRSKPTPKATGLKRGRPRKKVQVQVDTDAYTAVTVKEEKGVSLSPVLNPPPSPEPPNTDIGAPEPSNTLSALEPEAQKNNTRYSIREKRARVCYTELYPCGKCTQEFSSEQELKTHERWCRKYNYEEEVTGTYEEFPKSEGAESESDTETDAFVERDIKPLREELVKPRKKRILTSRKIMKSICCENYKPEDLTICTSCDTKIPVAFLVAHLKICWSNDPPEPSSSEEEELPAPIVKPFEFRKRKGIMNPFQWKHKCTECDRFFWLRPHLTKHMETEHGEGRNVIIKGTRGRKKNRVEDKDYLPTIQVSMNKNPRNPKNRPIFKCEKCKRPFKTKARLEIHEKQHPELNLFVCSLCDKGFKTMEEAEIHAKVHNGERPFACEIDDCAEKFTCVEYLVAHQSVEHPGGQKSSIKKRQMSSCNKKNTITCSMCPKTFPQKQALFQHMRSHSDNRPYQCTYEGCTAAYKGAQKFREHLRLHTGETPYKCDICGKGYARQFSYRMHVRRHTNFYSNFQCSNCKRKFTSNWALKQHHLQPCSKKTWSRK